MKYFLGIKNGAKHEFIPLDKLDERVNVNNNLRALCTYTMTFNSEYDLKQFLMAKKIVNRDISKLDIEIVYRRKYKGKMYSYCLDVPYKKQEKYLSYFDLAGVIVSRCLKYPAFLKLFLSSYEMYYNENFKKLPSEEFYQLRNRGSYVDELELYDLVRKFLSKECYRREKKGRFFSFLNLYNVAFTAIKVEEALKLYEDKEKRRVEVKKEVIDSKDKREETSWEIEGQMKLF